jgi:2-methylcitrate dehydratase PrpD
LEEAQVKADAEAQLKQGAAEKAKSEAAAKAADDAAKAAAEAAKALKQTTPLLTPDQGFDSLPGVDPDIQKIPILPNPDVPANP